MTGENEIQTPERPPKELIDALYHTSAATASGELQRLGITNPHILGPVARMPGKKVVGPALTLQFMPRREDLLRHGPSTRRGGQRRREANRKAL